MDLLDKITLCLLSLLVLLLTLGLKDLNDKVNELEKRQTQVNEYILNRIGG